MTTPRIDPLAGLYQELRSALSAAAATHREIARRLRPDDPTRPRHLDDATTLEIAAHDWGLRTDGGRP